jgi:hypothetical protein
MSGAARGLIFGLVCVAAALPAANPDRRGFIELGGGLAVDQPRQSSHLLADPSEKAAWKGTSGYGLGGFLVAAVSDPLSLELKGSFGGDSTQTEYSGASGYRFRTDEDSQVIGAGLRYFPAGSFVGSFDPGEGDNPDGPRWWPMFRLRLYYAASRERDQLTDSHNVALQVLQTREVQSTNARYNVLLPVHRTLSLGLSYGHELGSHVKVTDYFAGNFTRDFPGSVESWDGSLHYFTRLWRPAEGAQGYMAHVGPVGSLCLALSAGESYGLRSGRVIQRRYEAGLTLVPLPDWGLELGVEGSGAPYGPWTGNPAVVVDEHWPWVHSIVGSVTVAFGAAIGAPEGPKP